MYLNIEYKYLNSFSIFNQNYFLCNASASIKQYCRMVHEVASRNESVFVKQHSERGKEEIWRTTTKSE